MQKPEILLHICCAPCSTHAIQELTGEFTVRAFFYNPNMYPPHEYHVRLSETERYLKSLKIDLIVPLYRRRDWLDGVSSLANEPEGGERCRRCYAIRLKNTAHAACERGFRFFTTTLTVGPGKSASVIFPVAEAIAHETGMCFVARDFKKKDGFKKSCVLSRSQGMYRQNYCGCEYSLRDKNNRFRLRKQEGSQM